MATLTITINTDEWAVVPKVLTKAQEYAGCMNGIGPGVSKEVYDVLIAAAPRPEPVQQPDPWRPNSIKYDHSIHSNPDAKAWADFFVQTFPDLAEKHDLMLGLFANAMMAMHDHLMKQPTPRPVPTAIPTSERLPTEADADFESNVAAFDGMCWFLVHWSSLYSGFGKKTYTHWQPTHLKRPPAPGEQA